MLRPDGVTRPEGTPANDGVSRPDDCALQLSPPSDTVGPVLCTTTTGGDRIPAPEEDVVATAVSDVVVTRAAAAALGLYMGTEEMGFPMTGAGLWTGGGGWLLTDKTTLAGLWGLGSTTGGGKTLFWGRPTLMLSVLLALAGVLVQTTAGSTGAALTGASGGAGLNVGGAGGGAKAGAAAGAETEDGMSVSVVDLLGAGFIGGTFTDDIMTTGADGAAAGAVWTTTEEVDLTGSLKQ